jgi:hypothetical protein
MENFERETNSTKLIIIAVISVLLIVLYLTKDLLRSDDIDISNNIFSKYKGNKKMYEEESDSEEETYKQNLMKEEFFIKKKTQNNNSDSLFKKKNLRDISYIIREDNILKTVNKDISKKKVESFKIDGETLKDIRENNTNIFDKYVNVNEFQNGIGNTINENEIEKTINKNKIEKTINKNEEENFVDNKLTDLNENIEELLQLSKK